MDIYVLNTNLEKIGIVEDFQSVIWTSRYYTTGDFELYVHASKENIELLQPDNYLFRFDSDEVMIIEKVETSSSVDEGDYLTVTGRDLKSVLDRRIVWTQTSFTNKTAEYIIRSLLSNNIITPSINARQIANFALGISKNYNDLIENAQYTGDNLLEVISALCEQYSYGFKITIESGQFVFNLYKGIDRSYNQNVNPWVVFSDDFENIMSSTYSVDKTTLRNVALVAGEGEGNARTKYSIGSTSGIARRELWVDANDLSSSSKDENDNDITLTTAQYKAVLVQRGNEKLAEAVSAETFEGEVDTTDQYIYKLDYNLGDIVSTKNKFGIIANPRILEIIESESNENKSVIPTFSTWGV